MSLWSGPDSELRRCVPITTLNRVARRAHSHRIRPGNKRLGKAADLAHLLYDRLCFRVLPRLKAGIDEVVHRVQLIVGFVAGFGSPRRLRVGADGWRWKIGSRIAAPFSCMA